MIGAAEKGIEAARLTAPPQGAYEGVDLRVLPKYCLLYTSDAADE